MGLRKRLEDVLVFAYGKIPFDAKKTSARHERELRQRYTPDQIDKLHQIDFDDPEIKDVMDDIRTEREQRGAPEPRGVPRRSERPG